LDGGSDWAALALGADVQADIEFNVIHG